MSAPESPAFDPLSTLPADGIPDTKRRRWERLAGQAGRSYRAAVELKCLDCVCWVRTEARDCIVTGCALWAISRRIFRATAGDDEEAQAPTDGNEDKIASEA